MSRTPPPQQQQQEAAKDHSTFVLDEALRACRAAGVDPNPHYPVLMEFILAECRDAYREMREDATNGGPSGLLTARFSQHIYLGDAGRRAGEKLARHLETMASEPVARASETGHVND